MTISMVSYRCEIGFDCTLVDEMPEFADLTSFDEAQIPALYFDLAAVFDPDSLHDGEPFIINDGSIYQGWKDAADGNCFNCSFPDIDFNQYTLVGAYYPIECNESPSVRLIKDGNNYRHIVKASNFIKCDPNFCANYTFAWMIIPKDTNATFTFEKSRAYYDCEC